MSEISFSTYKRYGRPVTPAAYDALIDLIQRVALNSGPYYKIKRSTAGTSLVLNPTSSGSTVCPFDVTISPGTDGNLNANLIAGTINSLLPSNIFSTFSFDPTQVIQVKAHCVSDGQAITSCSLVVDDVEATAQTPAPNSLPTAMDLVLGVIVAGVWHRTIKCGSVVLTGIEQFRTDKDPPAGPGVLPYVPYYAWIIQPL